MFPRNAVTCRKCFQVYCCKQHRKNHENNCCARGPTSSSQVNPTAERKVCAQLPIQKPDAILEKHCSQLGRKRKFDCDTFMRPVGVAAAIHYSLGPRKILSAFRRKQTMMIPRLPSLKEEDEENVPEQPSKTFDKGTGNVDRKILGEAYKDFKRGSLSASPIALPDVPVGPFSSPDTDSESTPLPAPGATTTSEAATPLTFQIPRPPHKAMMSGVFKTSTPKDNDDQQEFRKNDGDSDEQNSSILPRTDSIEESPINSEPAPEEMNVPANYKETFLVNAVSPFIPATPMISEVPPIRPCNLMEGMETTADNQIEDQPGPSSAHVGWTLAVGDLPRSSPSTASYSTPFTGRKKKVSWASDTFDAATPYYSARSHFSFCPTPVTPLPNPSLFTSVKDVFKNFVSRMPGTSDGVSPARKRLKRVAESKIKCRPTYKGRYPKSRSYLVFNDE